MDIDFKNDLQDKIMKLTIKVKRRKTVNKPRVTVQWPEVENIVSQKGNIKGVGPLRLRKMSRFI